MNDNRNQISGCIVTYNNAAIISECIESILKWTKDISFKLYISDNVTLDCVSEAAVQFHYHS